MTTKHWLAGAVIALALTLVLSRFRWSGLPAGRVEVTGTVFLDGRPLAGALGTVVMGLDDDRGAVVAGRIDDQGRYRVDMTPERDGVAPGRYRVAVSAYRPGATGESLLPARYELAATSDLIVDVTTERRQTIDLRLRSK